MAKTTRVQDLARRQFDERLKKLRAVLPHLQTPRSGWVSALREAYGMSKTDLAARLGISRQALTKLESREVEGTATLASLSAAAEALGADLVWAVIPRESITKTLDDRAYQVAAEMVASVKHTMRLEDQETDADAESRIRELAEELKSTPNRLWSLPDDE